MAWAFNKGAAGATAAQPALAPTAAPAAAPAPAPAVNAAPPPPTAAPLAAAPAALPPVAAPAPTAPAAAAAPAPSRRRGRAAAPAAAAAAPIAQVPGQQTLAAAGVQPTTALAVPTAPVPTTQYTGFLSVIVPAGPVRTVAQAVIEGKTTAGEPNLFPTVYVTGGNQGGMFDRHEMNDEASNADLPVGRDPILAILLGYRLNLYLWPEAAKEGVKNRPRTTAHIPAHEFDAGNATQLACQRYNFRNRDFNAKYDPFGHPSCEVELLVFDSVAGLFCIRTTGTYDAMVGTLESVQGVFPGGQPQPVPVRIHVKSEDRNSKRNKPWKEHIIAVEQFLAGEDVEANKTAFNAFYASQGNDPGLMEAMQDWNKLTVTPEQLAALQAIATT